jgi:GNAT superfamily N-acetyltransferase
VEEIPGSLAHALEHAEVEVCRAWTAAASAEVARDLGLAVRPLGSGLAIAAARADVLAYNRVVGLGIGTPAMPADLDAAIDFFRAAGAPRAMVQLPPAAAPAELQGWLEARDFRHHNHWIKLWRDLARPLEDPPDARVRPMGREHAQAFAQCEAEGFDLPVNLVPWFATTVGLAGLHHYAAFDGPDPVGFGAVFASGRVAWLGFASTKRTHRRQGIQSALIATRLRAAAALGCEIAVVETADDTPEKPNPSTHNLVRMGFQVAYKRPNWVLKLETPG